MILSTNDPQEFTKIICIVAHPDDETLLFANTFSYLVKHIPLTIVSLTNRSNLIRSGEFEKSCSLIGAKSVMYDYVDGGTVLWGALKPIAEILLKDLEITNQTVILSHSPSGDERGHLQHVQAFLLSRYISAVTEASLLINCNWSQLGREPMSSMTSSCTTQPRIWNPEDPILTNSTHPLLPGITVQLQLHSFAFLPAKSTLQKILIENYSSQYLSEYQGSTSLYDILASPCPTIFGDILDMGV